MLVTPNWRVNPTPATAKMDAVTMPNPKGGTSVFTAAPAAPRACRGVVSRQRRRRSRSPAELRDLCRRHRADQYRVALHVFRGLEGSSRVVPVVEDNGPARAHVLDLLPGLQRGLPRGERGDDRLAATGLGDLHDGGVENFRAWAPVTRMPAGTGCRPARPGRSAARTAASPRSTWPWPPRRSRC